MKVIIRDDNLLEGRDTIRNLVIDFVMVASACFCPEKKTCSFLIQGIWVSVGEKHAEKIYAMYEKWIEKGQAHRVLR